MLFISNHTHTTDTLVLERFTSYAVADNSIFLDEAIEEGKFATILKSTSVNFKRSENLYSINIDVDHTTVLVLYLFEKHTFLS